MNISQRLALVQSNHKLHRTTSHVYQTLLSYCHHQKVTCFPSIRDIVDLTNLGERCVQKHIRKLELENLIETTPRTMPSGRKTSNLYTLVGLKEIQESELVNRCRGERRFGSEAIPLRGSNKNTYGPTGGRSDDRNPSKALIICDLEPSEPENQGPKKTAIAPTVVAKSQNKASLRFEGELTTQKSVEVYSVFARHGFIRSSYDSFYTFISNCSLVNRLWKNKKIRGVYPYLVWMYKNGMDRKLITAKDEELAKEDLKHIQDNGLMPSFTEAQPPLRAQSPTPQAPAPPAARISSRPAMDWPDKNLPETGKEAVLHKFVKGQRVTHVHPKWLENLNCWIARLRMVDGKMKYEPHPFTEDGWFKICLYSEIVPLRDDQGVSISQAEYIRRLIGL
jgi:hypothetical protein